MPTKHAPVKANCITTFSTDNIYDQAKVLNRAGKASGKYKSCYKIEYLSPDNLMGQQTWIDLDIQYRHNICRRQTKTTKTNEILLINFHTFNIAKEKELKT